MNRMLFRCLRAPVGRALRVGVLAAVVASSGGCGLHLYNAADDALAKKAGESFKAADLDKYIADERAALKATNERDLAATRRNLLAERDVAIIRSLTPGHKTDELERRVRTRLLDLGFPNDVATQKLLTRMPDMLGQAMVKRDIYAIVDGVKELPSFPPTREDEAAAEAAGGNAQALFSDYKGESDRYFAAQQTLAAIRSGRLGRINERLADATAVNAAVEQELAAAKSDLDAAVKAYKAAVQARKRTWDDLVSARKAIDAALARFDNILPQLKAQAEKAGLGDLLAAFQVAKLEAIRAELGDFLSGYAAQAAATRPSTRPSDAETAGRVAAVLVKAGKEIHDAATHTKLVPLLFEQERLRLEQARYQRAAERGAQRVALLQRQRDSLVSEGIRLNSAANAVAQVIGGGAALEVTTILTGKGDNDAEVAKKKMGRLLDALFVFGEAIAVDDLRAEQAEVELIGLDHEAALDASEYALNLWRHVIESPLNELLAYHGSGIKPEDVARFLQAAGVAGIAVGVNN